MKYAVHKLSLKQNCKFFSI